MDFLDFFLKEVLLVEKEDNGSSRKELVVAYAVEQVQRLMHAVLGRRKASREVSLGVWGHLAASSSAETSAPDVRER